MRKFKRLASLALAAVMTLGMCAPAFATGGEPGGEQPPVTETKKEVTYNIYQIFKGTYSPDIEDTLGQIKWGKNGKETENTAVDASVLTALKNAIYEDDGVTEKSNNEKLNVIKNYVDMNKTPTEVKGEAYKPVTVNVEPGYYLVATADMGSDDVATTYVVNVTGTTLTINPKTSKPTVEKKVDSDKNVNSAAVGDVLTFTIKGTLPSNYTDFETYYYQFTDTMDKGLELVDWDQMTIKVGNVDVKNLFNIANTTDTDTKITTITITSKDNNLKKNDTTNILTNSSEIVVSYKAKITKDANMGKDPTTNKVVLKYSNDPQKSGQGTDPGDPDNPDPNHPIGETVDGEAPKTKTYTTGLTVTDFAGETPMQGAKFVLQGDGLNVTLVVSDKFVEDETGEWYPLNDGTYTKTVPTEATADQYVGGVGAVKYNRTTDTEVKENTVDPNAKSVTAAIDKNGSLTIKGMNVGTYTLTQTEALPGYNMYGAITFIISFSEDESVLFSVNPVNEQTRPEGETEGVYEGDGQKGDKEWFYLDIQQGKGALLPETGGVGTTMMYIGGMLLIAMAGATIILKGKKAEDSAE